MPSGRFLGGRRRRDDDRSGGGRAPAGPTPLRADDVRGSLLGSFLLPLALDLLDLLVQRIDGLLHAADGVLQLLQFGIVGGVRDGAADPQDRERCSHR